MLTVRGDTHCMRVDYNGQYGYINSINTQVDPGHPFSDGEGRYGNMLRVNIEFLFMTPPPNILVSPSIIRNSIKKE